MIDYFEKRAREYKERSERGLWSRFRRFELEAVCTLLDPRKNERLLELGCGAGFYATVMHEKFGMKVLAVDSAPTMLAQVTAVGIETWLGDAESFPDNRRFDSVLAAGLLEFVERPAPVLKKAARALEPGGRFVMLIPVAGWLGTLYARFHRLYGCPVFIRDAEEYIRLCSACGLELNRRLPCTPISIALEFRRRP